MARKITTEEALKALQDAGGGIDNNALAAEFLQAFGGPKGLARKFSREYKKTGTTSIARVKILDAAMRVILAAASKAPPLDLSKLADGDLVGIVQRALDTAQPVEETAPAEASAEAPTQAVAGEGPARG